MRGVEQDARERVRHRYIIVIIVGAVTPPIKNLCSCLTNCEAQKSPSFTYG